MKTYIVYINGEERGTIRAGSHNAAEKKARTMAKKNLPHLEPRQVTVEYTEV